ncbi:hypothetical protein DFQ00_12156 [Paenibacillus barcinonensis]|uniref:Uncharacterized protein n=1 Tax=Paenibacillus barcinonensis TaxID=198119 RepID=A0A2V4VQE4_PAEBA|nr:hypothetical protein DFQ00_12156 [Paenibacillus barcinonensis]
MSYTHLSIVERSKLEILHQQGKVPSDCPRTGQTSCHHWLGTPPKYSKHPYGAEFLRTNEFDPMNWSGGGRRVNGACASISSIRRSTLMGVFSLFLYMVI